MQTPSSPTDLRTEYLVDPLGIDREAPRLSWKLPLDGSSGVKQVAYRIQAALFLDALDTGDVNFLWDSGRVDSSESTQIAYAGKPLQSYRRVWWRVCVWFEDGDDGSVSPYSSPAFFEMGLLKPSDWTAQWISFPIERPTKRREHEFGPAPYLRNTFIIDQPVVEARAYVTAHGLYQLYLNGKIVGDNELAPGWTDYRKRLQYQTYDITDQIVQGENAIGSILGDGWYCGYVGWAGRNGYGDTPELLLQIKIRCADHSTKYITSNRNWKAAISPIDYSDFLEGERYDARREQPGWTTAAFDDSAWSTEVIAKERQPDESPLVAQPDRPTRVTQELAPISVTPLSDGRFLVDMGQNMVGRIRLTVQGEAGTTITLRHAEMLDADGEVYLTNLRSASQVDEYVLRGGEPETFEPHFTFHGFRYVEISGYPGELRPDAILGRVLESDTEIAGRMETGNAMINQLISNIVWGQRGNFISIPTDCPQRDERLGWMGDAQVFVRTAAYNRNVAAFFTKWLADVRDAQNASGAFTDVCPRHCMETDSAPAWADAGVIVPWTIYQMYADRSILEASYDSMAAYIAYLDNANPNGLWLNQRGNDYGDWLSIEADTPKDVLATAYFAHSTDLLSRIATVLDKQDDARKYSQLFEKIRAAFNSEYVSDDGRITGDTQTVYLLALHMNLIPDEMRAVAAKYLVSDIEKRGGHLSTGFVGVSYLCPVLTEAGYPDVAYRLLFNKTFPSWGYSVEHGATTMWERWDGWTEDKGFQTWEMNSFNHYAFGSIGEWLYRFVAGIDLDPSTPGFKKFVLRPYTDPGLGFCRATYQSLHGEIASYWRYEGNVLNWLVTIPANTTAVAYIPSDRAELVTESGRPLTGARIEAGRVVVDLEPGEYRFQISLPA